MFESDFLHKEVMAYKHWMFQCFDVLPPLFGNGEKKLYDVQGWVGGRDVFVCVFVCLFVFSSPHYQLFYSYLY